MLIEPTYIIEPALVYASPGLLLHHKIAISIDAANSSESAELYKFLANLDSPFQYSIYLTGQEHVGANFQETGLSFFLSANYTKKGMSPLILVDSTIRDSFKSSMIPRLISQGLNTSGIHYVNTPQNNEVSIVEAKDVELVRKIYRRILIEPGVAGPDIWIKANKEAEIFSTGQLLVQEDESFKMSNPETYMLRTQLYGVNEKLAHTNAVLGAAQTELKNLTSHLEELRSTSQASELQRYYNNEYEVLPRWYKRVGHILKVLTGKRSMKSLMNNDVKKYKD